MSDSTPNSEIRCPHAPRCTPCPLAGQAYGEQLRKKRAAVESSLADYPELAHVLVHPTVGSRDTFGYRDSAKLAVRASADGGLRAGVYAPGSHDLVDALDCSSQHPGLSTVIREALEALSDFGLAAYDEGTGEGELRYIAARHARRRRQTVLTLVTKTRRIEGLQEACRRLRRPTGVVQNINPARGNAIFGREWAPLVGRVELLERIGPLDLQVSPGSFFQANEWTARRVYEQAATWAAPDRSTPAVDLYCGVGGLSLYLAANAKSVLGIENNPHAIRDAKANARRAGAGNAHFLRAASEEALKELRAAADGVLTLNPPRKGADPAVLDAIAATRARRVVYVSCSPKTLARDLAHLSAAGYRCDQIQPFDMLPQTDHVEAVARLEYAGSSDLKK